MPMRLEVAGGRLGLAAIAQGLVGLVLVVVVHQKTPPILS